MSRTTRLAELRALRASGKTRLSTYEVQEEERLYEEVDEEGYKKVVRDRLDRDDFVIDDNGQGYADDGREEWVGERHGGSRSGSEDELPVKGTAGKARCSLSVMVECSLILSSQKETRGRKGENGEDKQQHQQVFQHRPSHYCSEVEGLRVE